MLRFLRAILWAVLTAAVAATPALAVGEDVFVVPRVSVQAQAHSATAAKAAAQMQGRRRAMDILLRRLTVEEDWGYLPNLAAGEAAEALGGMKRAVISLTDRDLELLESGFEVFDEKTSPSTYRADITYRFKPASVRKLLKDAQIPYSEAQTRTALVLPVLETDNGAYLWEENNPWMAAWKARPYNNELTPMVAPLGDLEDATTISARNALALDQAALQEMALRYSVSQVIIAHAQLHQEEGEDRLRVQFLNGYRESGEIEPIDELVLAENDDGAYEGDVNRAPEQEAYIPARVGDVLADAQFAQLSGNFPMLAELAIDTAIAKFAKPWKERTLIDHTVAALLEVSAFYRSLDDWTKIRAALVSTPLIGSVQVRALSRSGAEMLVRAYGDPTKLVVAMEAQGLALWTEDDERWLIATPSTARSMRGDRGRRRSMLEPFERGEGATGADVQSGPRAVAPIKADF